MGQCTVLYRPPKQLADVGAMARQIIDDVLTVQTAVGSMHTAREAAAKALCDIQRQARALLTVEEQAKNHRLDGLVDLVTRLEQGEPVRHNELRQTLVTLEVATAKIKRYLEAGNGLARPAA